MASLAEMRKTSAEEDPVDPQARPETADQPAPTARILISNSFYRVRQKCAGCSGRLDGQNSLRAQPRSSIGNRSS